jgi:uncharacterized protein (DUF2237 family)
MVSLNLTENHLKSFIRLLLLKKIAMSKNVFGEDLMLCSSSPMTGYYRNGSCETGEDDRGTHTVCAIMTEDFLTFSKNKGNDLSTPRPEWNFPGLKPGDKWCLCASRWMEAYRENVAPMVFLEATNEKTLDYIALEELVKFAFKG